MRLLWLILVAIILLLIFILFTLLYKFRGSQKNRIGLVLISLFFFPFTLYLYISLLGYTFYAFFASDKIIHFLVAVFDWIVMIGITNIILRVLIKLSVKPYSKISEIYSDREEHKILEQGRSLLQYSIYYTAYISIIHVPICYVLFSIYTSMSKIFLFFTPIFYPPFTIFCLIMMYIISLTLSISGGIRIRYGTKTGLILMLLPIVNIITMIKVSNEARQKMEKEGYSIGVFEVKGLK